MICFWFLALMSLSSSSAQQYYDPQNCSVDDSSVGSRYTCNLFQAKACSTFLVYRSNQHFNTIAGVANLFQRNLDDLLTVNNVNSSSEILVPGREVIVPIDCSCSGQYFEATLNYTVSVSTTVLEVACENFEGLLKSLTLKQENPLQENKLQVGSVLRVALRCACPDNNLAKSKGVKLLVTYPLIEGDAPNTVCEKFDISVQDLWTVNHIDSWTTVFPGTTLLVPLQRDPAIVPISSNSPPPAPGFLSTVPVTQSTVKSSTIRNLYIAGVPLMVFALFACGLSIQALRRKKTEFFLQLTSRSSPISLSPLRGSPRSVQTGRSSPVSCLSPDLLVGIKYSLSNYNIEELKNATGNFNDDNIMSDSVYKGLIDNVEVMIKHESFEDTRRAIDVHSKINHVNILNFHGFCYGEDECSRSYIVCELPKNGCLRDCLSNQASSLKWEQRTQIAFDIGTGLHYLHRYTSPSYAHMNVNTRNIFLTENWRAKLGNIGTGTSDTISSNGNNNTQSLRATITQEFLNLSASENVDIFAFGVVLLELITGRADTTEKPLKNCIEFLGGGASEGGCFEQLRGLMDPGLKDYPLAEALCLAVLAKACVEDDPLHRPSMDDITKVLAKMI